MDKQLQLCRDLFGAVLSCQEACKVPSSFNSTLLDVLQRLMLEAVGLLQEEQVRDVRRCLEAVLQLLSRVSCLGPIEAFFTSDDLQAHYQRHLDAAATLTSKLQEQRQQQQASRVATGVPCSPQAAAAAGGANHYSSSSSECMLQLPEQQLRVVKSFRQQATLLCPRLVSSCPPDMLQQLCEAVREGLVLVNGHSFLLGEEWQAEVSAMLGRAEQLKMLLAHRQAHHLSLLAAMLQLLHRQEVQEYELPYWPSQSPLPQQLLQERPECASPTAILTASSQQHVLFSDHAVTENAAAAAAGAAAAGTGAAVKGGLGLGEKAAGQLGRSRMCSPAPQQAHVMVAAGLEVAEEVLGQHEEDDEFYMPVAPLPVLSSAPPTPSAAAAGGSCLPFELATRDTYNSVDLSDDSLARLPSSGCSSLLEYVHSMPSGPQAPGLQPGFTAVADEWSQHGGNGQPQLRRITEEQLQSIAGPEAAPMLAAALGVVVEGWCEGSRGSYASSCCSSSNRSLLDSSTTAAAATAAATAAFSRSCGSGVALNQAGSGLMGDLGLAFGRQTGDGARLGWGVQVEAAARQLSELAVGSTAGSTTGLPSGSGSIAGSFISSGGGSRTGSPSLAQRQQQQRRQRQRQRPLSGGSNGSSPAAAAADSSGSSGGGSSKRRSRTRHKQQQTLRLQHTLLPAGCCRSIGAVLYLSPQITRLVLVEVGLDDQAVGELVDALRVNSSVVLLDISRNKVEDIGARVLAGLLKQRSCSSSQLRALYLQHNAIGDDGATALASSLVSNSQLQRLWLQHNCIGAVGAMALARAMQHNTSCTRLKLLTGNCGVPKELGQMAQKLAWHNRGMRDRIKGILQQILPRQKDR